METEVLREGQEGGKGGEGGVWAPTIREGGREATSREGGWEAV